MRTMWQSHWMRIVKRSSSRWRKSVVSVPCLARISAHSSPAKTCSATSSATREYVARSSARSSTKAVTNAAASPIGTMVSTRPASGRRARSAIHHGAVKYIAFSVFQRPRPSSTYAMSTTLAPRPQSKSRYT